MTALKKAAGLTLMLGIALTAPAQCAQVRTGNCPHHTHVVTQATNFSCAPDAPGRRPKWRRSS